MPISLSGHFAICSVTRVSECIRNYTKLSFNSHPPFCRAQVYWCLRTFRISEITQSVLRQCAERFSLDNAGLGRSFTYHRTTLLQVQYALHQSQTILNTLLCEQQILSSINRQYTQLSILRALQSFHGPRHVSTSWSSIPSRINEKTGYHLFTNLKPNHTHKRVAVKLFPSGNESTSLTFRDSYSSKVK
jgi:hypothetical protein